MDLENQEPTADANEKSAPRKRAPRRVVSTDVTPSSEAQAPASTETSGPEASGLESSGPDATDQKPRRRRAPVKTEDKTDQQSSDAAGSEQQDDNSSGDEGDDSGNGFNRNRQRGRGRDRRRGGRSTYNEEGEQEISDDDVLIPIGGILDVLDNYAFVRTQGYLPGPTDVYVSLGQVKKYNLRKGDAVIGAIRQPREGEHQGRQKYNALVSVDSINGQNLDESANRVDFADLTAVYPTERLRMETAANEITGRVVDIFTPVGKGQRAVIVGAPKTGKSAVVQAMANAIAENTPDAHLMVVLVDEHPEAITELQREAKGEVIASTFDRSADDHTTIAELAIERAKRLVELGHDVVVFVDSLTRLARAYQQVAGGSRGGAQDTAWLYPTKKLFGAARNVENGGSLTIIATLVTGTGLPVDDVVASEVAGSATLELHVSHDAAAKRLFPAMDISHSATRKEDLLLASDESHVIHDLRRALANGNGDQGLAAVLDGMKTTSSNVEFLLAMQKKMPNLAG